MVSVDKTHKTHTYELATVPIVDNDFSPFRGDLLLLLPYKLALFTERY